MVPLAPFPARPLNAGHVLAVDIGGTKFRAGFLSFDGLLRGATLVPTPRAADAETLWAALETLVLEVLDHDSAGDALACGVGCGGPMRDRGDAVSPLNIPGWRDFPLRSRLHRLTGLPTFVDNDAKALALGEGRYGAARGKDDYLAMVVSTGVGGGLVVDGRLVDGRLGNAGHVGHVVVVPEGRRCVCGGRGCLEAEASGLAIESITGRAPAEAPPDVVERAGTLVGRAVASVAALCDLDLAVVAGSVALGFGAPFFAAAQAELSARARLSFVADARIIPGALGADGPLVGAGAVGFRGIEVGGARS
ncbi:MAG TPA: ROK family protein [Acidimicrobiales bacterium]|nr:ROK family protein [Acidimicrobiales bacterium]